MSDCSGRLWFLHPPHLKEIVLPSSRGGHGVFAVQPKHGQTEGRITYSIDCFYLFLLFFWYSFCFNLFKLTNLTDQSDNVSVWKNKNEIVFNLLIYSWGYREHSKSVGSVLWTFIVCKWVPSIQFIFGNGLNDGPFWYDSSPVKSVSYFY